MVTYFGAERIKVNVTMSCDSTAAWVRMPGSGYEYHFLSTPRLANANFSFADFVAYAHRLNGNLSETTTETYNQFMDFHVGTVTDDMTPFYDAMTRDSVPFFLVAQLGYGYDLFVEIPGTGAIFELTSQTLDVPDVPISYWDICQTRTGEEEATRARQPQRRRQETTTGFPTVNWRKTTFASPKPFEAQVFGIKYLGAHHTQQDHRGVWVRGCAKISWIVFDYVGPAGLQYGLHFVDGYQYTPRDTGLNVTSFAQLQADQRHFDRNEWDEWANNRVELWVDDLADYYNALAQHFHLLLRYEAGLYTLAIDTALTAGNVISLVSDRFSESYAVPADERWNFCPPDHRAS